MSGLSETKRHFCLELIHTGRSTPDGLSPREACWFIKAQRPLVVDIEHPRRLINRFKVGADPELIVHDRNGNQVRADSLGLLTGRAFGADNNGRLVEIRPRPSRFVLEVAASLWSTMRWLNFYLEKKTEMQNSKWYSPAYWGGDGLGGHIHFGRRRDHREAEITGLDNVWTGLSTLFDKRDLILRLRESTYGRKGDYRLQQHGYEYRSMASWLDSPQLAYLALTLAKLAVYSPELTYLLPKPSEPPSLLRTKNSLLHLLAYYKARDDDAAIAHRLITERGWPKQTKLAMQRSWNISYPLPPAVIPNYFPPSIPASELEVRAFYDFLLGGTIAAVPLVPNWAPTNLPKDYLCFASYTRGIIGLGEIINTLCYHAKIPLIIVSTDHDTLFVSAGLAGHLAKNWQNAIRNSGFRLTDVRIRQELLPTIWLGRPWRTLEAIRKTKKLLTCGIFPIWSVAEVTDSSFKQWSEKATRSVSVRGTLL